MEMNEDIVRLKLSDRLVIDLQSNWGGWDLVVTIYGKYDTTDAVKKMNLEWEDGAAVHKYLDAEGWIDGESMRILESFDDFSKIDPEYKKESTEVQEEPYKDSYGDEPPTDLDFD